MAKEEKVYKVKMVRYNGRSPVVFEGDLDRHKHGVFGYTLSCGASYAHEKGNKKINCEPKTIKGLITNLNNAVNNSAMNGCANEHYELVEE